jgi:hypothetical protein
MAICLPSILFQTPDGQPWIANYNTKGEIICNELGTSKAYKLDDLKLMFPDLVNRIKLQLENYYNIKQNQ